ncbi:MAG: hypothetical protein ABIO81_11275 [Ginsengibacter sp.]
MKQAIKTTKMVTIGLFTLCTMGLSHVTYAGVKTGDPIELKFIGKSNNNPVFQLNLNNAEAENYFITMKDGSNNLLYSGKVRATSANFSVKYQLDIDAMDLYAPEFGLRIDVTSAKTHKTQVYRISSHTTVNENIVVAKL